MSNIVINKPPIIITKKYDFILSKKKVVKFILLKPNFSSITKVLYRLKGSDNISVIIVNMAKNKSPVSILLYPKDITY